MTDWILSIPEFAIGLIFWIVTYIGAPIESRKKAGMFPAARELRSSVFFQQGCFRRVNGLRCFVCRISALQLFRSFC